MGTLKVEGAYNLLVLFFMDQLPSVTVILFKVTLQPLFKFRSDFVHGVNPNTVSEFLYNLGATGPRDDKRRIEGSKDDLPRGFVHMGSGMMPRFKPGRETICHISCGSTAI